MKKHLVRDLAVGIGAALAVGLLSALLSGGQKETYDTLTLPPASPPPVLFGIIWPILYTAMGIASVFVFRSAHGGWERKAAFFFYAAQLAVNALWSPVFFRFRAFGPSLVLLACLLLLVLVTAMFFFRCGRAAGFLLLPYAAWLVFAFYLNAGVVFLNRP